MEFTAYLAPEGYEEPLEKELKNVIARYGRLFLAAGPKQAVYWAQNIWLNPKKLSFQSISEGAQILRALGALWAHFPIASLGRAKLIEAKLPYYLPKPLPFLGDMPKAPLGSWTLLDDHTMIASSSCSSPFVHGEMVFQETKEPPSRAYLKLWEFFARFKKMPQRGEKCLEIGASPGSWTWALEKIGAQVIAVDRAPLCPKIQALKNVSFQKGDAFSLRPEDFPDVKWVFSDVVCYPQSLYEWLQPWIEKDVSLVCTLKFQGTENHSIIEAFAKIPNSHLVHLSHNKHELTWWRFHFV